MENKKEENMEHNKENNMDAIKEQILTQNKIRREREQKIEARKMADIIREYVSQAKEAKKMEEISKSLNEKNKLAECERRRNILEKHRIEKIKKVKYEESLKEKNIKLEKLRQEKILEMERIQQRIEEKKK
eukprot:381683_1